MTYGAKSPPLSKCTSCQKDYTWLTPPHCSWVVRSSSHTKVFLCIAWRKWGKNRWISLPKFIGLFWCTEVKIAAIIKFKKVTACYRGHYYTYTVITLWQVTRLSISAYNYSTVMWLLQRITLFTLDWSIFWHLSTLQISTATKNQPT